jgi:hypothetical protein
MRLGELTISDDGTIVNHRKITSRTSVHVTINGYQFFLPSHKGDRTFEGNTIIIQRHNFTINPLSWFTKYLASCDQLFPFSSDLWLCADGSRPTRSFFINV